MHCHFLSNANLKTIYATGYYGLHILCTTFCFQDVFPITFKINGNFSLTHTREATLYCSYVKILWTHKNNVRNASKKKHTCITKTYICHALWSLFFTDFVHQFAFWPITNVRLWNSDQLYTNVILQTDSIATALQPESELRKDSSVKCI